MRTRTPSTLRVSDLILLLGAALAVAVGSLAIPAQAIDHGTMGVISPDNRELERDYPPMAGIYPYEGTHAFAYFRPPTCRTVTYCDAHQIQVDIPDGFDGIYALHITLSWPNHPQPPEGDEPTLSEELQQRTANQLTFHVWGDDGPIAGGSVGPCGTPRDANCMGRHPLHIRMVDPAIAGGDDEDDPEAVTFMYLTVVNARNPNAGYTLNVKWEDIELPPLPELEDDPFAVHRPVFRPSTPGAGSTGVGDRPLRDRDLFVTEEGHEGDERPPILIPGPDGELTEVDVPLVAAGTIVEEEQGVNPWLTALIAAPALSVLGYVLYRRRRGLDAGP